MEINNTYRREDFGWFVSCITFWGKETELDWCRILINSTGWHAEESYSTERAGSEILLYLFVENTKLQKTTCTFSLQRHSQRDSMCRLETRLRSRLVHKIFPFHSYSAKPHQLLMAPPYHFLYAMLHKTYQQTLPVHRLDILFLLPSSHHISIASLVNSKTTTLQQDNFCT
jgi:hypothetical protein